MSELGCYKDSASNEAPKLSDHLCNHQLDKVARP